MTQVGSTHTGAGAASAAGVVERTSSSRGAVPIQEVRAAGGGAWLENSWIAVIASVILHGTITLLAAVFTVGGFGGAGGGTGTGGEDPEFTITSPVELTMAAEGPMLDANIPSMPADVQVPELATEGILEGAGGVDAPGAGPGLGTIADGLGGAGGGGIGEGAGIGAGGSGGGGASFFGVEAKGSRILYICDISGSMDWDEQGNTNGKRLRALKRELSQSIQGLLEHTAFYVVFFQSVAMPINDTSKWLVASDVGKSWAIERVQGVSAFGGTEPWPAFERAFQMRPRPDSIYFMTDGNFDPSVATRIQAQNSGARKIPIHCITLIDRSGEEVMRRIAAESGGTYAHVGSVK